MIVFPLFAAMLVPPAADPACAAAGPEVQMALASIEAGKLDEADQVLLPLQSRTSGCSPVLVALGRVQLARRNYDRANELSQEGLAFAPEDPVALAFRGQMLVMQGRGKDGLVMLEQSVKLDQSNAEAFYQLGVLYDRAKRNQDAVSAFEQVVKLRPRDARAYDYLALNLEPVGRITDAEAAFRKGLEVNQKPYSDSFLDYNYGRLLLKLNRLQESKEHLDKALQLVPQLRMTNYDHAKLNLRMGNLEGARDDAEKALSIPDRNGFIIDLQVYTLLAQIYTRLGDEGKARKYTVLAESTKIPVRSGERK
jgi:tetratricopeptide (TPR) repeat protein